MAAIDVLDEGALLAGLRAGEDGAFAQLVRAHGGRLLAVAARILGNEEDARDAVQDGFLAAFRGLGRFEGQSQLATWLHRIVLNAALMKLRSRRRKPEQSIDPLLPTYLADGHQTRPSTAWCERAETALQRRETRELVRNAIDRLPDTYRTVLHLRDIDELSTEETARMLGVTEGVVKTRLHRARQALRTLLDPYFVEEAT